MHTSRLTQRLVTILLLSSVLSIIPSVDSQQFTTSTSILTSAITQTTTYNFVSFTTTTSTGAGTGTFTQGYYSYGTVTGAPCKLDLLGTFNSRGLTHFAYSVSEPTTLYILSGPHSFAITALLTATTLAGCTSPVSILGFPSHTTQISGSGTLDLNLPPADNPYIYAMITPDTQAYPNGSLAISPLWGTYTIAVNFTTASTATFTLSTTVTSLTSMKLQPNGNRMMGLGVAIGIVALIIFVSFYLSRLTKRARTNLQGP